jgi:hypothetical protein
MDQRDKEVKMENFFEGLAASFGKVPEVLYHYTTQTGLIGIIRNSELWMTHTQYLNDTQEFRHAIELVEEEIQRRIAQATDGEEKEILEEMQQAVDVDHSGINVCVSCFSEAGDSLSQWRAYGGDISGYSIGFYGDFLSAIASREGGFLLARCIYDGAKKRELVSRFVQANIREIAAHRSQPQNNDIDPQYWRCGGGLMAHMNKLGPILKDSSFGDEREWRIISRPLMCSSEAFDYRPGASMIIPYYRLDIGNTPEQPVQRRFRNVIVGPTPHKQQAINSVRSLLTSRRLTGVMIEGGPVSVESSSVPYRAW